MNLPETSAPAPARSSGPSSELRGLRTLMHATAMSVLILTAGVFVFVYGQVNAARKQTAEIINFLTEYDRSNAPEFIEEVHRAMLEFKQQNPDFTPIYTRYFGTNLPAPPKVSGAVPLPQ